jgi:hypothetical protein
MATVKAKYIKAADFIRLVKKEGNDSEAVKTVKARLKRQGVAGTVDRTGHKDEWQ